MVKSGQADILELLFYTGIFDILTKTQVQEEVAQLTYTCSRKLILLSVALHEPTTILQLVSLVVVSLIYPHIVACW